MSAIVVVTFKDEGRDEDGPFGPVVLICRASESCEERSAREAGVPFAYGPHEAAAETCRELTDAVARRIADQNKRIAQAISRGIEDGSIRSVNPEQTAALLWAAWNGIIGLGSRPDALRATERDLRRQLAAVTEAILRGARATASPEPEAGPGR